MQVFKLHLLHAGPSILLTIALSGVHMPTIQAQNSADIESPGKASIESVSSSSITPATHYSRRNDLQTTRRDDAQSLEDWTDSFSLGRSGTRIKAGGFIELDVIHDNDAIQSRGQFIASTIPTRNATLADGKDGQTSFSLSPSRVYLETRSPYGQGRLKTFISIDMYDDELGTDPRPRLRLAYVELSNTLLGGDLLFGQAWSTSTDLEATPDVLDFRGSDSLFGRIQPQVRWSRYLGQSLRLMISLETPENHVIEGADSLTRYPDNVIAATWDTSQHNLMASIVTRDLRASFNNEPAVSNTGFGGSLSGRFTIPYGETPDEFMFSATAGKGIGSHFNNAQADAVYDPIRNTLETISLYGVTLAYKLTWSPQTSSTFVYCCIEIDNHPAQAPTSVQGTEYSSANLVWQLDPHWLMGIEGIWGKRKDNDDTAATVFRTQFTTRLSF